MKLTVEQKLAFASVVRTYKDILFRKDRGRLIKQKKEACWRLVAAECLRLHGFFPVRKNRLWSYVRDIVWDNLRRSSLAKLKKCKSTRAVTRLTPLDRAVLEIIGESAIDMQTPTMALDSAETGSSEVSTMTATPRNRRGTLSDDEESPIVPYSPNRLKNVDDRQSRNFEKSLSPLHAVADWVAQSSQTVDSDSDFELNDDLSLCNEICDVNNINNIINGNNSNTNDDDNPHTLQLTLYEANIRLLNMQADVLRLKREKIALEIAMLDFQ